VRYQTGYGAVAGVAARVLGRSGDAGRGAGRNWQKQIRLLASLALIGLSAPAILLAPGSLRGAQAQRLLQVSGAKHSISVTVAVGKTEDVRIDAAFSDITIGDSDVADISPLTDRTISILGKKIGTTRVTLYGEGKMQIGLFDIEVTYDVTRLATEIGHFSDGGIKVSSVNGRIMLSGTAHDAVTLDKAMIMARQFAPDPINTVTVLQAQQVMLEVRFIEASRQASRELGVQWNSFGQNSVARIGSPLPASSPGNPVGVAAGLLSGATPYGFLAGVLNHGSVSIDVALNALEQKGLARSLAEPNLVALSGDTASFLAGGKYPIPVPGSLGTVTIDYERYGVGLSFTPTVLKDGLINLKIMPQVSELDFGHSIQINGTSVPPLILREASTTVELRDGQSFAMAGLLQNTGNANFQQLPWLADVPVLGALLRSTQYQKKETDLVIIVTPHLVQPARPGDPLRVPTDNAVAGNDADLFLLGRAELTKPQRRALAGVPRPLTGHMLNLEVPYAAR
jgi:pilus assembly protein CpaC